MTHDEADAALRRGADAAALAYNRAGEILRECARQGVRPPDAVEGLNADGEVELCWAHPTDAGGHFTLVAGPRRWLVWEGGKYVKDSPNAGRSVRWLRERLAEAKEGNAHG
jgi:hypothetical protein